MNALIYNSCLAGGTAMLSGGAAAQWGAPMGLMVAGALLITLTIATALVARVS